MSDEPPISRADLRDLFAFLDRPNPPACAHTHAETIGFLRSRNLPVDPVLKWLRSHGGYCDCEVIFNVTEDWGERVGWQPLDESDA